MVGYPLLWDADSKLAFRVPKLVDIAFFIQVFKSASLSAQFHRWRYEY